MRSVRPSRGPAFAVSRRQVPVGRDISPASPRLRGNRASPLLARPRRSPIASPTARCSAKWSAAPTASRSSADVDGRFDAPRPTASKSDGTTAAAAYSRGRESPRGSRPLTPRRAATRLPLARSIVPRRTPEGLHPAARSTSPAAQEASRQAQALPTQARRPVQIDSR